MKAISTEKRKLNVLNAKTISVTQELILPNPILRARAKRVNQSVFLSGSCQKRPHLMEGEVETKEQRKAARKAAKAAKAEKKAEKAEKKLQNAQKREQKAQKRKEREEKTASRSSGEKSPKKQKTENGSNGNSSSATQMEVEPTPAPEPSKKRGRDNSNGNTLEQKRPKTSVDPALVRKFREENNISVSGDIPYWPIFDFADAGFSAGRIPVTFHKNIFLFPPFDCYSPSRPSQPHIILHQANPNSISMLANFIGKPRCYWYC